MMKLSFLVASLLVIPSIHAQINCNNPINIREILHCNQINQISRRAGLPPTLDCRDGHCDDTTVHLISNRAGSMPRLTGLFSAQQADCTNFIRNDGTYGAWGEVVRSYVTGASVRDRFLGNQITDITHACPRWANLNQDQRTHFWVWTYAAISWDESRCRSNARNTRATNGVAVGLLQLEENASARRWRGPNCRARSIAGAAENLRCGLDIMAELLKGPRGEYRSSGAIFSNSRRTNSYWEKLRRPGGGTIGDRIKSHPLCQNPSA